MGLKLCINLLISCASFKEFFVTVKLITMYLIYYLWYRVLKNKKIDV